MASCVLHKSMQKFETTKTGGFLLVIPSFRIENVAIVVNEASSHSLHDSMSISDVFRALNMLYFTVQKFLWRISTFYPYKIKPEYLLQDWDSEVCKTFALQFLSRTVMKSIGHRIFWVTKSTLTIVDFGQKKKKNHAIEEQLLTLEKWQYVVLLRSPFSFDHCFEEITAYRVQTYFRTEQWYHDMMSDFITSQPWSCHFHAKWGIYSHWSSSGTIAKIAFHR